MKDWLRIHRLSREAWAPHLSRIRDQSSWASSDPLLTDVAFNNHERNDGKHVSPFDNGMLQVGLDGLEVRLLQGIDEESFARVLSRATRATTGLALDAEDDPQSDWEEMMRGGLQSALETQTVVFEVWGASRALTHQLVRSRRAGMHQQSQRATWYGDRPEVRMPESVWRAPFHVRKLWIEAVEASWAAYKAACDEGISYQDARYILTEGTTNYIMCEYTIREFLAVYAYRACSMFLWEMVHTMRTMGKLLIESHPMLKDYVKISCEKGPGCSSCKGSGYVYSDGVAWNPGDTRDISAYGAATECDACSGTGGRKCTFQGWENVEGQCTFPWAKQANRVFLPSPKYRIGAK